MHKGLKKGIAVLAAAVLFCGSAPVDIYAANTVTISTRKDFLRFAKNCTLDSWSAGKTVVLTADIDLGRVNFSPIPIFGGTFEGNGHTISGLNLEQDGSQLGLFRYVAEGGVVKNLKVEGNVTPGGSRSSIGGIVGENNGTITGCSFDGTVEGKDTNAVHRAKFTVSCLSAALQAKTTVFWRNAEMRRMSIPNTRKKSRSFPTLIQMRRQFWKNTEFQRRTPSAAI